jgi:hypothetical protein
MMIVGLVLVARFNRRAEHEAIARGLCPVCEGAGADHIMPNGFGGCWGCDGSGTLHGHNAYRRSVGQRELTA